MAISLASLRSARSTKPPIIVLYGVDGIGKTSLAAEFPDALYLPTEGERPPSDVDLPTPGTVRTIDDLWNVVGEILSGGHDFKTVIVDSLDGLEGVLWGATCARLGVSSIEEPGFGKGYVEADTEWREYLSAVGEIQQAGIGVVQIAHPEIVRFDSPTTDPYSRYTIKLHKRGNALVREQADIVAFMNYRVTLKEKEVGPKKTVTHAEGGKERQVHLVEGAGFTAKNRYSMPDSIRYVKGAGYTELSKYFPPEAAANDNVPAVAKKEGCVMSEVKREVKVGDRVKALSDHPDISAGNIYTVIVAFDGNVKVHDDVGDDWWLFAGDFELVAEDTPCTLCATTDDDFITVEMDGVLIDGAPEAVARFLKAVAA